MKGLIRKYCTDKKRENFPHILGNSGGLRVQSYNALLIYGENICAFPHILGSPSSCMTLHPIPSEFLHTVYEETFVFFFISVGSGRRQILGIGFGQK
jgi:hypothetical protein